ncbi:FecR family protein [Nitrincola alkalilacustris]|uniref:FecR family protein n=1 Tax=Nitrincola alkalilacustris TaxID=1571224 RepID=UPI00124D02AE|nr:FecR domain-containing protein [Nitrincola alkalilacustris]
MIALTTPSNARPWSGFLLLLLLTLLLVTPPAFAQSVAEITNATGTVHIRLPNGSLKLASVGSQLNSGEIISVEQDSSVRIRFTDGTELVMKPGSRMRIDEYHFQEAEPESDNLTFSLLKGGLRAVSGAVGTRGNQDAFRGRSAVGSIGIRGTEFGMVFCEPGQCDAFLESLPPSLRDRVIQGGLFFEVTLGVIIFINDAGEFILTAPEWGYAESEDLPPIIIREEIPFPLRQFLPLIASGESVGGFSAGLGVDMFAQCLVQ